MIEAAAAGMPGLVAGYFLRTTAVLTAALVAAALMRRKPAAVRHFILASALAGLLLLPFFASVPGGWRSTLVPRWMAPAAGPGPESSAGAKDGLARPAASDAEGAIGGSSDGRAVTGRAVLPGAAAAAEGIESLTTAARLERENRTAPSALATTAGMRDGAAGPGAARADGRRRPYDFPIALLWSAGLAVLALRLAAGLAGALKLTAEGRPLDGAAWLGLLERFLALVPLRRKVRLKSHPDVRVPLTWGWRRPVVIMPEGSDAWSEEDRSSALFHELSHIKRADFAVMLAARASLAVFWWNPLGWAVYRELLKEQERACDELVLRAGIRPSSYAASLLAFRRSAGLRWNPSAALLGILGRAPFQERLTAILKQKMTLMEVKMRTKIMLALGLTAAVALVGTARPVAGNAAPEAAAEVVLAAAALPAPAAFEAAAPGPVQETKAGQEKAKQAEKAKRGVEKTIVISPKGGEGKPLEIVITEGDEMKTLVVEKPLTLTTRKDGGAIVLSVDGKDIQILEGEPLRLEINGGGIQVLKEGQAVFVGGKSGLKIVKEGGDEGQRIVFYGDVKPEVAVDAKPDIVVRMGKDAKKGEAVTVVKEGEPAIAWTVKEGAKDGKAFAVRRVGGTDMLEKVRALQEQVQAIKAKKLDLAALEESLKKLENELQATEEKVEKIRLKLEKTPGELEIVKRIGEDEVEGKSGVWVYRKGDAAGEQMAKVAVGVGDKDDRAITMVFTGRTGEEGRADYEKALAQLKKELPEGYKIVEQKYDADEGEMRFKVEAPEGAKTEAAFIRKVLDSVKSALK